MHPGPKTEPVAKHVKVHFRLEVKGDWPPASVESLWAIDRRDGTVQLDNTPWFVRGVATGDILSAHADEDGLRWAGKVLQPSQNCTIRLIVLRDNGSGAARQSVLHTFAELGVGGEGIDRFGMVALDVPPEADLAKVQRLLNHGVAREWWHVEEGCVTDAWRATQR
ncbi:DUF4265 domain-containing protein [Streptomyces sp. NPDC048383]|uniref:DUF4265 domain-containing protein n=1 Tax=Streptomyces sp. NPDC048383 TaxID=3155386 RepID=UPI003425A0D4